MPEWLLRLFYRIAENRRTLLIVETETIDIEMNGGYSR
jgi:hypothetical protein